MSYKHDDHFIWNRVGIFVVLSLFLIAYFYFLDPHFLVNQKRSFFYELTLILGGGLMGIAFRALANIGHERRIKDESAFQLWIHYLVVYPAVVFFLTPLISFFFFGGAASALVLYTAEVSAGFLLGFVGYGILHKLTDKVL